MKGPFILFKGRQIGLKADHKESFDDYVESRMVKLCKYSKTELDIIFLIFRCRKTM